jgi:alpha-ketoglutarate-dependent taurine dioxygenase
MKPMREARYVQSPMSNADDLRTAVELVRAGQIALLTNAPEHLLDEQLLADIFGPLLVPENRPTHIAPGAVSHLDTTEEVHRPRSWHFDQSFLEDPPTWSALLCVDPGAQPIPTAFCDTAKLFSYLSPGLVETLEHLRAVHSFSPPGGATLGPVVSATHPVVIDVEGIDESDRRALYVAPATVDTFVGWEPWESDGLINVLFALLNYPEFSYVHRWARGDLLLFPSRRFAHRALPGGSGSERQLRRVLGYWQAPTHH